MNKSFLIFFAIVFIVYLSVNSYIFIRGLQSFKPESPLKGFYIVSFVIVSLTFWAGRITENYFPSIFTDVLVWIGSFWLAFILYFLIAIILLDIIRLINHFIPFYPNYIKENYQQFKEYTFYSVVAIVSIIVFVGHINYRNPRIYTKEIEINKKAGELKALNIVVASDIHMGTIVTNGRVRKLVEMVNSLNPDLILLPGDILDEDLEPVIRRNLGDDIKKLEAKYGVFAVNGNHEFIGGAEAADKYLRSHGINLLRDSVAVINNDILIVGREDLSVNRISQRKTIEELLNGYDKKQPIILLDHQPFKLYESENAGVDLHLSGHTHHGQLFPFNYLTEKIYEVSWGYKKKGDTHVYVSSGYSGWGPPVRLGSRTEIVNIKIKFN
ncbi:MAG TPA: metallophosphoesterase [Melioribacteraceae bacterium]|nr:metallophosphoesterase [Melioribacteraceae bacterium]